MKRTAILVDAEWFRRMLQNFFAPAPGATSVLVNGITADVFYRNALLSILPTDEEVFRLFCYDCEPFDKPQQNPIDKSWIRFGPTHPQYIERMKFFKQLAEMPFVALRRGVLKGGGWEIKEDAAQRLFKSGLTSLAATDLKFGLEQKGVDMRIGMDVAALSLKKLVERIILISGDTDMVPAMKLARREGIQVCVVQVGPKRLAEQLVEDSDILRHVTPVP